MPRTVILSSARTPIGRLGGGLSSLPATELGAIAIREALERADVAPEQVEHVVMGTVLQAGQGQIPSRQAQIAAGIPLEVSSETINKVCASGIRAAGMVDASVRAGDRGGGEPRALGVERVARAQADQHVALAVGAGDRELAQPPPRLARVDQRLQDAAVIVRHPLVLEDPDGDGVGIRAGRSLSSGAHVHGGDDIGGMDVPV
jgi:acetyl-CoA acetyltransferase